MLFCNLRMLALSGTIVWLGFASVSCGQAVNWINPGEGDWNTPSNWSGPFGNEVPLAAFGETAIISNGGTAVVNGGVPAVGAVTLGQTGGQAGSLKVPSGGLLSVVSQSTSGALVVGPAGSGAMTVESGGTVFAVSIASGAGLSGTIRMIGPSATVTANSATLSAQSNLITEITSDDFTPMTINGAASLGGTYRFEFSGAYTPTVGTAWSIIDATSVSGSFATIDTSAAPLMPLGQRFVVTSRPGGLGRLIELRLDQVLVLTVDRNTGILSIGNAAGGAPISFDGYSVTSSSGAINVAGWNSLKDQNVAGWLEANPTSNRLSELSSGQTTILGGNSLPIGPAYVPVMPPFGIPVEDLQFQYTNPNDGSLITGVVNFINGIQKFNNLVLEINASGAAQILNDSHESVAIDGYTITSSDGSLLFANGSWNSLDDQNTAGGDWLEANGTASRLSEFKASGATQFNGTNGVSLGTIFNTSGSQSGVAFQYLIDGQTVLSQGAVVFRNLSSVTPIGSGGITGDYNDDGIVNAADYALWRDRLGSISPPLANDSTPGSVSQEDYGVWRSQFGATAGSGASAAIGASVPEPATWCLSLLAAMGIVTLRRK